MKLYGNLTNRICEGQYHLENGKIEPGTDITMYYWSDRVCYYVTEVESSTRIKVKKYQITADQDSAFGIGHQDWKYFKTKKERNDYLHKYYPENKYDDVEDEPETWVFRNNKWKKEFIFKDPRPDTTEREMGMLNKYGFYARYQNLPARVSFGVRSYYYDWSF